MRASVKLVVMALALVVVAGSAEARKRVWTLGSSAVVVSNGERHEYVLRWEVPGSLSGVRIDQATLEFYVDAVDGESTEPYHVAVGPATNVSAESGAFSLVEEGVTSFASAGTGQDQRVVVDVTGAVRYWVGSGGTGYLAIVGEGVADRAAALSTGNLGGGAVARLTVWASNR